MRGVNAGQTLCQSQEAVGKPWMNSRCRTIALIAGKQRPCRRLVLGAGCA